MRKKKRTRKIRGMEFTLSVGLGALFDKSIRVLEELSAWLDHLIDLVHLDLFSLKESKLNLKT